MDATGARKAARGVVAGRQLQMEAIVAEYETALLRYASRLLRNPVAAQDVVQNVFVKLFRNWQNGSAPTGELKGWLYRVTHNEAVDHIRRESRLRVLHEKQAAESEDACGAPVGESADERRERVLACLARLHPREQQVLLLRLQEGLSYREISQVTGRTEGNVGNILHHAVQKLARRLRTPS